MHERTDPQSGSNGSGEVPDRGLHVDQLWSPGGPLKGPRLPTPKLADNTPAVVGVWVSGIGGALLLLSVGLLSPISLILGIVGTVAARRGRRRLADGLSTRHADYAKWGFVLGIATTALSIAAIGIYIVLATSGSGPRGDKGDPSIDMVAPPALTAAA